MVVLVTGATGFLGSHVVRLLADRGVEVRALVRPGRPRSFLEERGVALVEGDLLDETSLRQACRGVEALVHCAALRSTWSRRNHEQRQVNVEGTARLFRAAHDHGLARIVHVSTAATLGGNRDGRPLDESGVCNLRPLRLGYVDTKVEAEERARAGAWGGMPIVIVNPSALIGPRLDGRVPTALRRVATARLRWIPSGGTSFADVEDVAVGTLAALERGRAGERYVLGGHNLTWREFDSALANRIGRRAPALPVPDALAWMLARGAGALDRVGLARPGFTPEIFRAWTWYTFADSGKAERELGYRIRPLAEMLDRLAGAGRPS